MKIIDAAEYYYPEPKSDWVPPVRDHRFDPITREDHKDYKETPILDFNWRIRLMEGMANHFLRQAFYFPHGIDLEFVDSRLETGQTFQITVRYR